MRWRGASARWLKPKRCCAPAIRISRACAWRCTTGRRSCGSCSGSEDAGPARLRGGPPPHRALDLGPQRPARLAQVVLRFRLSQSSADVPKYAANRKAVSAVIDRSPWTMAWMRLGGTWSSRANALMLRPRGFMNSSARISPGWIGSSGCDFLAMASSVIVDDLDLMRIAAAPHEADPPALVDANAVLAGPVALEGFQVVARRATQIFQAARRRKVEQLPPGHPFDGPEARHGLVGEQRLRIPAAERANQSSVYSVACIPSSSMDGRTRPSGERRHAG